MVSDPVADRALGLQVLVVGGGLGILILLLLPLLHRGVVRLLGADNSINHLQQKDLIEAIDAVFVALWSGMGLTICWRPWVTGWKLRLISVLSSMGVVASPSSLGRRYILGVFFFPLHKTLNQQTKFDGTKNSVYLVSILCVKNP